MLLTDSASAHRVIKAAVQRGPGRIAIVTGGTSGIGKEIVRGLLEAGFRVHLPARNLAKAEALVQTEFKAFADALCIHPCDLANVKSAKTFMAQFRRSATSLDLLINNAGNYTSTFCQTADGLEAHMAVHVMGTFLLTEGLADLLRARPGSRVINVVSSTHAIVTRLSLAALTDEAEFSRVDGYCNAKFAQLLLTKQLAFANSRPGQHPVPINAVHPGLVKTDISRDDLLSRTVIQRILGALLPFSMLSARRGALTALWLALSEEGELRGVTGRYFHDLAEEPVSDMVEEAFRRGEGRVLVERCRALSPPKEGE